MPSSVMTANVLRIVKNVAIRDIGIQHFETRPMSNDNAAKPNLCVTTRRGGISGYWVVKAKRRVFGWKTLVKYSIFAEGDDRAFQLATRAKERLA